MPCVPVAQIGPDCTSALRKIVAEATCVMRNARGGKIAGYLLRSSYVISKFKRSVFELFRHSKKIPRVRPHHDYQLHQSVCMLVKFTTAAVQQKCICSPKAKHSVSWTVIQTTGNRPAGRGPTAQQEIDDKLLNMQNHCKVHYTTYGQR